VLILVYKFFHQLSSKETTIIKLFFAIFAIINMLVNKKKMTLPQLCSKIINIKFFGEFSW